MSDISDTDTDAEATSPEVTSVGVHYVSAEHVRILSVDGTTWANLGPVTLFGTPDELMAIGNEIVRQAAALGVEARVDAAEADDRAAGAEA